MKLSTHLQTSDAVIQQVMDWLWQHENRIEYCMRADSKAVYDFISTTSPLVFATGNGHLRNETGFDQFTDIEGAILAVNLYCLSKINVQGQITCRNIQNNNPCYPALYVIRTIIEAGYENMGIATGLKKDLIEYSKTKGFGSIWGHHEQGSTMQHINLKLGAEEIMTEPRGWNGSDKTHILYRITL